MFEEEEKKERKPFSRKMFQGNWKCAECGKEITELPFEPTKPVSCRSCYIKRKNLGI